MPLSALALMFQEGTTGPVATVLGVIPIGTTLRALVMVILGVPLVLFASRGARAWMTNRMHAQAGLVAGKLMLYGGLIIVAVSTLRELGFSLT
ncbi:MAG: hypothetical protein LC667_04605, partial [Thioalkalivibrio sp.]|nr:hypothetical protein [Thioalkalivibrio sp.]